MKRSELRVGWQVTLRSGETSVVKSDGDGEGTLPFVKGMRLDDYNEDLTSRLYPDYDITAVYGWPDSLPKANRLALYFRKYRTCLWQSEATDAAAALDEAAVCGDASAKATVNDGRLFLCGTAGGKEYSLDLCPHGSKDELITNGERIDYEIFRSLKIVPSEAGYTVTVTTEAGHAVYDKAASDVTAEDARQVYVCRLSGQGLIRER